MVEVFDTSDPTVDVTPDRAELLKRGTMHYPYYPEAVSDAATYAERTAAIYKETTKTIVC